MVVNLYGGLLWARQRGKPSVSFEWVKRRLDHRPHGGGQNSDNRDCSYAYTGRIHKFAPWFVGLERHCLCGSGQKGDEKRIAGSLWFNRLT